MFLDQSGIHAFFIRNTFFFSLSVAQLFNELSLNCCLSIAYYTEALSYRDMLYFVYLSLYARLRLFMSYLCDLLFHYHFLFHYNLSYNLIDTEKLVFWICLSKVQPQGVA